MPNCNEKLPSFCGGSRLPTFPEEPCSNLRFTGLTDVTIAQGDPFDLEAGVHAYDGNGDEIAFTYTPTSIDTSVEGEYVVTYTATGVSDSLKPSMRSDFDLYIVKCGNEKVTAQRTITVVSEGAVVCTAIVCQSLVACS